MYGAGLERVADLVMPGFDRAFRARADAGVSGFDGGFGGDGISFLRATVYSHHGRGGAPDMKSVAAMRQSMRQGSWVAVVAADALVEFEAVLALELIGRGDADAVEGRRRWRGRCWGCR